VIPLLEGGLLSTVNLIETQARMLVRGASAPHSWNRILSFQCEICPLTAEVARIAAELTPTTSAYGLSLGDRACLALAIHRRAKAYTADRKWTQLSIGIEIEAIR